jgi:hypothetical protein
MKPGTPILFYESGKSGGRKAIVAVGRIVDSVLVRKQAAAKGADRRLVVDDLADFSAMDDVLMTTFDNLIVVPKPVRLSLLKQLGVVGGRNLRSATPVDYRSFVSIVETGWA